MTTFRLHLYGQGLRVNCDDQYSLINIEDMEYWVKKMELLVIPLKVVLVGLSSKYCREIYLDGVLVGGYQAVI